MKPRLLDLFCCEGGAAMGYHRAGFDVVGVDIDKQRRYPFEFHQADALEFPLDGFDAIHASPPCQAYSITKHSHKKQHPDLIGPVRERLIASGLPYVIANVPGAPLVDPVTLCGAAFGLTAEDTDGTLLALKRHRLFESNVDLGGPTCECRLYKTLGFRVAGAYGGGSSDRHHAQFVRRGGYTPAREVRAQLIGADWMTLHGLSQSVPPAYTFYVGTKLIHALEVAA